MKQNTIIKSRLFVWIMLLAAAFTSCNEPSDLGMELLPSEDKIQVRNLVEKNSISAFTHREDSIRTDEPPQSILGVLDDPVFGRTTVNFATQFRLEFFPDYGENPVADSINLYLYYRQIYGDTVTPQTFKVYELESGLDYDAEYAQDVDLKSMASNELLGQVDYTPRVRLDSATADTFYQVITIPLDISLAEKLMNADSMQMINNDVFLEFFKGLYIESEKQSTDGGAILSLAASSTSNFQGSALAVFYNNEENLNADEPDTLLMPYVITPFSARVNSISHDYTGTPFYEELNSEDTPDSLIYVQATGGLKARVFIEDLSLWRDSANTAINKAELVFQIDTLASEVDKYPPPRQLLFTVVGESGEEFLPADYVFSPNFYGGILNRNDYTYRFNITQHMQQIIEGEAENYGFYLTPAIKSSEANRVILKGSESKTGIKLIVTYTKFLQ
ncbi:MAG: DUF4270 domain-containing protein [Prolixibacteraceae bacterium]